MIDLDVPSLRFVQMGIDVINIEEYEKYYTHPVHRCDGETGEIYKLSGCGIVDAQSHSILVLLGISIVTFALDDLDNLFLEYEGRIFLCNGSRLYSDPGIPFLK
jgi:hypothetical protein